MTHSLLSSISCKSIGSVVFLLSYRCFNPRLNFTYIKSFNRFCANKFLLLV
ncbi:hypothetical protein Hanom_Chr06g00477021 [Helianthus anomalus]